MPPTPTLVPPPVVATPDYSTKTGLWTATRHALYAAAPIALAWLLGILPILMHNPKLLPLLPIATLILKFVGNYFTHGIPKIEDIGEDDNFPA